MPLFAIEDMSKKWVIADIHGCFKTLARLIETHIQPGKEDQFYFLGDYIDRGPASKEVIDFLMHFSTQFQCVFLMGNHEEILLKAHEESNKNSGFFSFISKKPITKSWKVHGGTDTLKSYQITSLKDFDQAHIRWMESLYNFAEEEHFLLAHAGFNFEIDDIFSDTRAMRWVRDFEVDFVKTKNRKVIHGHTPVSLSFIEECIKSNASSFIDLDNGCVYKNHEGRGNLVALELHSMELKVQKNID